MGEWVGAVERTVPELGRVLGRRLVVAPAMARPILALRLARPQDGDAMIAEIARLTLGEWKIGTDGTLTLVQDTAARNRARIAERKNDADAWAATARLRRQHRDPAPDWQKLSRQYPGLVDRYAESEDPRPLNDFVRRTPEGRLWNRLAGLLPLHDLSQIPIGAFADRGGAVVRPLPQAARVAIRGYLDEWAAWHDARRLAPPVETPTIVEDRVLGANDAPTTVERMVLRWAGTPRQIDFQLRLYDRAGNLVAALDQSVGRDEATESDQRDGPDRETRPYPPIPLAQVHEHSPYTHLPYPEPALVEAAWDVLRNDPAWPAALPLLAEAERRDRSLVALRPDEGVEDADGEYDLGTPAEWDAAGLTERGGILVLTPPDPMRREYETIGRALLDGTIRLARRRVASVAEQAGAFWAAREFPDNSPATMLPLFADRSMDDRSFDGERRWWIVLGGLTPDQRRIAATTGLPLTHLRPELRERILQLIYAAADFPSVEKELSDAHTDSALRWPDGPRNGLLHLSTEVMRSVELRSGEERAEVTVLQHVLLREVARDPRAFGVEKQMAKIELEPVAPVTREKITLTVVIEDCWWSGEVVSRTGLGPAGPLARLPAAWKKEYAEGDKALRQWLRERRNRKPNPDAATDDGRGPAARSRRR